MCFIFDQVNNHIYDTDIYMMFDEIGYLLLLLWRRDFSVQKYTYIYVYDIKML